MPRKPPDSAHKAPAVVMRPLDALVPYARNARTHSDAQVAQIAASIREFGWTNPILTDGENGILAGHGRVLAARVLGMTEAPCIDLAHLSKAQRRAYILADNKLALNAGWDTALLAVEFADLKAESFDLALTGFGENDLRSTLGAAANEVLDTTAQLGGTKFSVVVECADEHQQGDLLGRLEAEGYSCRLLMS